MIKGMAEAQETVRKVIAKASDAKGALNVAGGAVQQHLRSHFVKPNQRPDKKGWAKSGFWSEVRNSVVQVPLDRGGLGWQQVGVRVQVNDPRFSLKEPDVRYQIVANRWVGATLARHPPLH